MKLTGHPKLIFTKTHKAKIKARILKTAREKKITSYDGIIIILSVDSSMENLPTRGEWVDVFKVLKETAKQEYLIHQSCLSEIKVERLEGVL